MAIRNVSRSEGGGRRSGDIKGSQSTGCSPIEGHHFFSNVQCRALKNDKIKTHKVKRGKAQRRAIDGDGSMDGDGQQQRRSTSQIPKNFLTGLRCHPWHAEFSRFRRFPALQNTERYFGRARNCTAVAACSERRTVIAQRTAVIIGMALAVAFGLEGTSLVTRQEDSQSEDSSYHNSFPLRLLFIQRKEQYKNA